MPEWECVTTGQEFPSETIRPPRKLRPPIERRFTPPPSRYVNIWRTRHFWSDLNWRTNRSSVERMLRCVTRPGPSGLAESPTYRPSRCGWRMGCSHRRYGRYWRTGRGCRDSEEERIALLL